MINALMMDSQDSLVSTVTQLWAGWSEVRCLAHQHWGWYSCLFNGSQGKAAGIQSWLLRLRWSGAIPALCRVEQSSLGLCHPWRRKQY